MFTILGNLVLIKPAMPSAEPPLAASDILVVGGEGGDIIGGESGSGSEIKQEP